MSPKLSYPIICIDFLIVTLTIVTQNVNSNVIIETKYGPINGFTQTYNGIKLNQFLGIPYAEPPLGQLRFKKPIPLKGSWKGTLNATKWPDACAQQLIPIPGLNMTSSEDCLYLNVFVPVSNQIDRAVQSEAKPVMVWIHGGGWIFGFASGILSPHYLSVAGDVILVAIHYRLNIFGFIYADTDDAPGNVGLWDQVLALKWIKENIANFGGDSERVTIFGLSSGGASVTGHIVSPASRHLFQNAIVMSGAFMGDVISYDPQIAKKFWADAAYHIGCGKINRLSLTPEAIDCLINMETNKLTSVNDFFKPGFLVTDDFPNMVVHDTEFLPQRANRMLKNGNYKKNVNLLVGITDDEGSSTLAALTNPKMYLKQKVNLTLEEAYNELKKYALRINSNGITINGEDVAKLYFTGVPDDSNILPGIIGKALGDHRLGCPTLEFAKFVFKGDHRSNVYQYYYTRKLKALPFCFDWMGACHGTDVWFMSGFPFFPPVPFIPYIATDDDRRHSENFMSVFTHFARHSSPAPQFDINWPKFFTINDEIIAPYYAFSHNETHRNFHNSLKHEECDILWKLYIDN